MTSATGRESSRNKARLLKGIKYGGTGITGIEESGIPFPFFLLFFVNF